MDPLANDGSVRNDSNNNTEDGDTGIRSGSCAGDAAAAPADQEPPPPVPPPRFVHPPLVRLSNGGSSGRTGVEGVAVTRLLHQLPTDPAPAKVGDSFSLLRKRCHRSCKPSVPLLPIKRSALARVRERSREITQR